MQIPNIPYVGFRTVADSVQLRSAAGPYRVVTTKAILAPWFSTEMTLTTLCLNQFVNQTGVLKSLMNAVALAAAFVFECFKVPLYILINGAILPFNIIPYALNKGVIKPLNLPLSFFSSTEVAKT